MLWGGVDLIRALPHNHIANALHSSIVGTFSFWIVRSKASDRHQLALLGNTLPFPAFQIITPVDWSATFVCVRGFH